MIENHFQVPQAEKHDCQKHTHTGMSGKRLILI